MLSLDGLRGRQVLVKSKMIGISYCKHCTQGQPCENSCISTKYKCHQPPGCAC